MMFLPSAWPLPEERMYLIRPKKNTISATVISIGISIATKRPMASISVMSGCNVWAEAISGSANSAAVNVSFFMKLI